MIAQLDLDYIRARPFKVIPRVITHFLLQGRPLTTKAHWLNSLLFKQFAFVKHLPFLSLVEKPIFILGTGRSGTTILGKVLSMHPHINFLNEPKALWHVIYPYEDVIGSYTRGEAHYQLGSRDATEDVCRTAHQLYSYALTITGSKRILDKYPEMIFRIPFLKSIFPDAKFLFLIRNGWDTVKSIADWSKYGSVQVRGEVHDWWGVNRRKWSILVRDVVATDPLFSQIALQIAEFSRHEDMAAVEWIATMHEGMRWMKREPNLLFPVYFEQLTSNPRQILQEILAFCDLPNDPVLLDYATQIIKPPSPRDLPELSPLIKPLFLDTMKDLNYQIGAHL